MKGRLVFLFLVACAFMAQATLPFAVSLTATNEVPPNNDPSVGYGSFTLDGNSLSFIIHVPADTFTSKNAAVQGPAGPGTNAPVIFDLGESAFQGGSPEFGIPPYYVFFSPYTSGFGAGPFTLTDSQVAELKSDLWYVNVTSYGMTNGQVRGQILLQPQATLDIAAGTNNSLQITVSKVSSLNYILQTTASPCFTNWTPLTTNTAPFTFRDVGFTNYQQRFYRALYNP